MLLLVTVPALLEVAGSVFSFFSGAGCLSRRSPALIAAGDVFCVGTQVSAPMAVLVTSVMLGGLLAGCQWYLYH